MRTHAVMQYGDLVFFREDFLNIARVLDNHGQTVGTPTIDRGLSGGQVLYYGVGHGLVGKPSIAIVATVDLLVTGSNQALWSLGDGVTRKVEVGISVNGTPYVWGTAQVTVGYPLTDDSHDVQWSISNDGTVTVYVDGVSVGSTSITFGEPVGSWRLVLGGSVLGTLAWSGTVRRVQILSGQTLPEPLAVEFAMTELAQDWFLMLDSGSTASIDWGDGSARDIVIGTGALQEVTHLYAGPGTYNVILYVDAPGTLLQLDISSNGGVGEIPSMAAFNMLDSFVAANNLFSTYNPANIPLTCVEWDVSVNDLSQSSIDNILDAYATDAASRPAAGDILLTGGSNLYPSEAGDASLQDILSAQPGWNIEAAPFDIGLVIDAPVAAAPYDDGDPIACSGTYDSFWRATAVEITYDGSTVAVDVAANGVWSHTLTAVFGSNDISVEVTYDDARTADDSVAVDVASWAKGLVVSTPAEFQPFFPGDAVQVSGTVDSPDHVLHVDVIYGVTTYVPPHAGGVYSQSFAAVLGGTAIQVKAYYDDLSVITVNRTIVVLAI